MKALRTPKFPLASPQRLAADKAKEARDERLKTLSKKMFGQIDTALIGRLDDLDKANASYQRVKAFILAEYKAACAKARVDYEVELERILKGSTLGPEEKP